MRFSNLLIAAGLTLGLAGPVHACGADFPFELLDNRARTLLELPEGTFRYDFERLKDSSRDNFNLAETDNPAAHRETVESAELPKEQAEVVRMMRNQADDMAAYEVGSGLPEAIRLYTAGAVMFNRTVQPRALLKEWESEKEALHKVIDYPNTDRGFRANLDRAYQRFQAVLDLPAEQNGSRAVWAEFMQGRVRDSIGEFDDAVAHFRKVRDRVRAGAPDPLGLAIASLGEEALVELNRGNLSQAFALYALAAGYGSGWGFVSMEKVAKLLLANPAELERALVDSYSQRVMVSFALSRPNVAGLEFITRAIEKQGLDQVKGADRLAALAYRLGQFDLAERLVDRDKSTLALWVKAKLELRNGNQAGALDAYTKAIRALSNEKSQVAASSPDYLDNLASRQCRLNGERGVVELGRGDYLQAFELLYAAVSEYWVDVAYVAERVLTSDELKRFVDAKAPTPNTTFVKYYSWSDEGWFPSGKLRELLARRLMREGRWNEAMPYFSSDEDKTAAAEYAKTRRETERMWIGTIARAKAWFEAANIMHSRGYELLATELSPDYHVWDGSFETGGASPAGTFTSADEVQRFESSRARPDLRYHYRLLALDDATHAADLLPPRSQAFAAVLCHATGWYLYSKPAQAKALYQRYIREGPYVSWAAHFGSNCPEPDFEGAGKRLREDRVQKVKRFVRNAIQL